MLSFAINSFSTGKTGRTSQLNSGNRHTLNTKLPTKCSFCVLVSLLNVDGLPRTRTASLTHKEISFTLRKSLATIHERTRRLKEQGYIIRTVAILDRKKINKNLIAFSQVLLNDHTAEP